MDAPTHVPEIGTLLLVECLITTGGMLLAQADLDKRRAGEVVKMHGIVGGHGGDVWWCKHENGDIAPYCWSELEYSDPPELPKLTRQIFMGNGYSPEIRRAEKLLKRCMESISAVQQPRVSTDQTDFKADREECRKIESEIVDDAIELFIGLTGVHPHEA